MKKLSLTALMLLLIGMVAAFGPQNSQGDKVEMILYGAETLYKLPTGDGGFQLWITGDREWHCIYKPEETFGSKPGWTDSSWAPGFVYKCNVLD